MPTTGHNRTTNRNARNRSARRSSTPRRRLLCEIADQFTVDAFLPEEAAALLFGRVETAKRIMKAVRLRQRMMETGAYSLPVRQRPRSGPPPMRPVRTLSRLNRSTGFPSLVVPKIECSELSLTKIINFVRQRRAAGAPSHCLLDLLSTASGLSVATCAELLVAEKIIEEPLDPIDIAATCAARLFWTLYAEARALHSEMVADGNVPRATGDLAFFDRRGLEALLPGVILPDHCRRREFITNYLAESDPPCVDLYSASGLPLVRHPFISTLNPLLFEHPSKSEIKSPQLTL